MSLVSNAMQALSSDDQTSQTQLVKLKLAFDHQSEMAQEPSFTELFAYNGTTLNALSSSLAYNGHLILLTLVKDPRVCRT